MKKLAVVVSSIALAFALAGCVSVAEPVALPTAHAVEVTATPEPVAEPTPTPEAVPVAPAVTEAVITFYGSDIQVIGGTYDDTFASEDRGRVAAPYEVRVPLGVGFYWGAVSWNGANDAGCKVTVGDRVVIDNTGPNQMSANCVDYDGVN